MTRPVIRVRVSHSADESTVRWELVGRRTPGDAEFLARHISHVVHEAEVRRVPLAAVARQGDSAIQVEGVATPLDRLLAEAIPDGTFGGARPPAEPAAHPACRPAPDPQAAEHYRVLAAAIGAGGSRRRHLRVVPDAGQTTEATTREAA